jgi:prepilin-type N-terminal cleavage/methylation domain-containing protein
VAERRFARLDDFDLQGEPLKAQGRLSRYARSQSGYTLIEVVITAAIGAVVMSALTSVVLTTFNASKVATSRVEASSQIRSFEFFANDDFAHSGVPATSGCGTVASPCSIEPLVLNGVQVNNSVSPVPAPYQVTYTWDGSSFVDRQTSGGVNTNAATNVSAYSWYLDGASPRLTVVVSLTVTVGAYSQSQTLRFYPQVNP